MKNVFKKIAEKPGAPHIGYNAQGGWCNVRSEPGFHSRPDQYSRPVASRDAGADAGPSLARFCQHVDAGTGRVPDGVRRIRGRDHHFPGLGHRRMGSGDHKHAFTRRHCSGGPVRYVQPSLDRHVRAARAERADHRLPLGQRRARRQVRRSAARRYRSRDQGGACHP